MNETFKEQLQELASTLVTPERFGKVAMGQLILFPQRLPDPAPISA